MLIREPLLLAENLGALRVNLGVEARERGHDAGDTADVVAHGRGLKAPSRAEVLQSLAKTVVVDGPADCCQRLSTQRSDHHELDRARSLGHRAPQPLGRGARHLPGCPSTQLAMALAPCWSTASKFVMICPTTWPSSSSARTRLVSAVLHCSYFSW